MIGVFPPGFAGPNLAYYGLRDTEQRSDVALRARSFSDLLNLLNGQLRTAVFLATSAVLSALTVAISHVVARRPQKQMVRVDADSNVAPVADVHSSGNRAVHVHPRQAVHGFIVSLPPHRAVSRFHDVAPPKAAPIRAIFGASIEAFPKRCLVAAPVSGQVGNSHCRAPIAMKVRGPAVGGTAADSRSDCSGAAL